MNEVTKGAWAQAICNGEFISVKTLSGYRDGARVDPKGKEFFLTPDASDEALGTALLDALAQSRFALAAPRTDIWVHPEVEYDMDLYDYKLNMQRYGAWVQDLMARYGYKSKGALFREMKNCSVEKRNGVVTLRPTHHEKLEVWGRKRADGIEDVVIPAESTPAEFGAALRLAFSRCT